MSRELSAAAQEFARAHIRSPFALDLLREIELARRLDVAAADGPLGEGV